MIKQLIMIYDDFPQKKKKNYDITLKQIMEFELPFYAFFF